MLFLTILAEQSKNVKIGVIRIKKRIISVIAVLLFLILMCLSASASDNDTYLSEEIQQTCIKYGEEYGICPELLMAMIEKESLGRPEVVSKVGCVGLMQIYPKYHQERMEKLGVTDLTDIDGNIHVGADYLSELFEEHGEIYMVLMSYNMGEGKANKLYEQGKISKYALSISERAEELERLHGK